LAYVAVSRGRFDTQIYTDDRSQLGNALSRELSHRSALEAGPAPAGKSQTRELPAVGRQEAPLGVAR
jgi:hypothetical protein